MNAILSFDVEVGKIAMNQGLPLQLSGSFSFSWQILKKEFTKYRRLDIIAITTSSNAQ